ncbi:MAG: glycine--tRNA ligase subunit beta [Castellaniella sp.]
MPQSQPTTQALLIELLTEELPPRALHTLGQAFARGIHDGLAAQQLLEPGCSLQDFATPRRLALRLDAVREQAPDQPFTEKLMPVKIGLDADGKPTPALLKRLQAKGLGHLEASALSVASDGRQDFLFAHGQARGARLQDALEGILQHTIAHLPIPKVMHYTLDGGDLLHFVRPAHGLVALWGSRVIDAKALGLSAGRHTRGHRFMGQSRIALAHADEYEDRLLDEGCVIVSFTRRRAMIEAQLHAQANALACTIGDGAEVRNLLDEVTALVEHPTVYMGTFEEDFLEVPPECLILTMRLNQKYFPLFDAATGALTHRFLIVSNMQVADPQNIIEGNERVVRPRLADAQFFYDTDRRTRLADRVETLGASVYHNRLGSQLDRVGRLQALARHLAQALGADAALCERAARLAKADLTTGMVGEFPELQGVMGSYYARHDGENPAVVRALREQYLLRIAEPVDEAGLPSAILFLAERLETLVGIWGIGLQPTGERDPFGLRRAALGVISAYEQLTRGGWLPVTRADALDLRSTLEMTAGLFAPGTIDAATPAALAGYIMERYRNLLAGQSERHVIDAVLAATPPLHQVRARIQACEAFAAAPQADRLAAANKRVANILRRAEPGPDRPEPTLLREAAEHALVDAMDALAPEAQAALGRGDFTRALLALAPAAPTVDRFFDEVMIMAEEPDVRDNRLAVLRRLHGLMNTVADISQLAS